MMRRITTIVVDDEPLARQRAIDLLDKEPDVDLIAECADGYTAIDTIVDQSPDLVFLDIQMPEIDGFQVIEQVGMDRMPATVFVTAYDQYAIQAFEVHALDYLLKPYDDDRFRQTLERAKAEVRQKRQGEFHHKLMGLLESQEAPVSTRSAPESTPPALDRFVIKEQGESLVVKADDIDYLQSEGVYVRLHQGTRSYLVRAGLSDLETRLDARRFCRIHRSTIVNLDRIKKLTPHFHGDYLVVLHDGAALKLSRSRRDDLQSRLGAPL